MSSTKDGYINYKLKKFNMKWIPRNSRVLAIGKSGTGKSTIAFDLLYHHRKIEKGVCISGTQDGLEDYAKIMPKLYIFDEYKPEILQKVIKTQRTSIKNKGKKNTSNCLLVMDDCLFDDSFTKHKEMKYIFFNSRHDKILFLLTMQFPMGIPPALRSNADFIFILRENIIANRKRIYEQYAGMFPNLDVFCNIMDECTEDFNCLVIHNTSKSNKFEDQVFWYKAEQHGDFKIGSKKYWNFHSSSYNENHEEETFIAESKLDAIKSKRKPKNKKLQVIVEKEF